MSKQIFIINSRILNSIYTIRTEVRKKMKKLFSVLISLLLVLLSVAPSLPVAYAATKDELEQKINEIDSQIAQNKQYLASLENKKNAQQEYLDTLEKQISTVEDKVSALETQIGTINGEIEACNNNIRQLQNEIAVIKEEMSAVTEQIGQTETRLTDSKNLLSQKLRSAYMNGDQSTMRLLMGSHNLAGFLTSLELMKRMSEEDKKVINDFKQTVKTLNQSKSTLEEKQSQLDEKNAQQLTRKNEAVAKKKELVLKQNEHSKTVSQLEQSYKKVEEYIEQLDKNSAVYENYIKKLQADRDEADAEIDRIIKAYQATTKPSATQGTTLPASNNSPSSPSGTQPTTGASGSAYASNDTWVWPLGNASCYISSNYGYRNANISGWPFHGGMDITGAGIYGKPIYASRSGTVVTATWSTSKKGYGNYVIIDHGDGYMTLYGHCSSLLVTTGQAVAKGQAIARVGDSGNVTGTHLHFEVRYNGVKQNPANYVRKP